MSGVWNTAQLDITIPSNGSLTPGSGTIYIGGPRLPSVLSSFGVSTGIIFYSDSVGLAAGINYWFIGKYSYPTVENSIVVGWVDTSNTVRFSYKNGYISTLNQFFTDVQSDDATLSLITGTGGGFTLSSVNAATSWVKSNVGDLVIKGGPTHQDDWKTATSSVTFLGKASTVNIEYRLTPDYIAEVRWKISCNSGGWSTGVDHFTLPLPGWFPLCDTDPLTLYIKGSCRSFAPTGGGVAGTDFIGTTMWIDYSFTSLSGTGVTYFAGQQIYTGDKP